MKTRRPRVAIVGLGKMGLVHSGILNVLPHVQLVALCEKSKLIQKFSRRIFTGIEIVDNLRQLSGHDLDAVYVTTPIRTHFGIANTVLKERIAPHIFVEKTLAQNYQESKQLSELVGTRRCVNMVGYLRRFYVTFNKARELVSKDTIGKVTSFRAYAYSSDFAGMEKVETSASRGGVLRDLGCHAIDLASWFFGDLQVSSANHLIDKGFAGNSVTFEVGNPRMTGEFSVSWLKEDYRLPEVGFSITGLDGSLEVNDDQVTLRPKSGKPSIWYRHDLNDNVPFWLGLPEYYREDLNFINSVIGKEKAEPDFRDASRVDEIISQVEEKAGEGNKS